ncbi:gluconokinase [Nocardioides daedukensis]|uniref:Gluconokinase n=1 Tax=Nocardioides daedukensis TaxID=634462 RepID=A0A7Y9S2H6_9ACTN|nr:gluconokinase [Nocardioides daedukensis]NYG59297.1 gluconokinase [Nocardioides daedukensis]
MPSLVVMGVSGTGKSSVGRGLATALHLDFVEGDDHHPRANIEKMTAGIPLDDDDRRPWLEELAGVLAAAASASKPVVLTCSALKRSYRDQLRRGAPELVFVHLSGTREVLLPRMAGRERHFMPTELLDSQLATLEPLDPDERGVVVDVAPPLEDVIAAALDGIRRETGQSG